jgi:hypothetical protein
VTLDPATLAALAAGLFVAFAAVIIGLSLAGGDKRLKSRIERASGIVQIRSRDVGENYASLRRDQPTGRMREIDAIAQRVLPRPGKPCDRFRATVADQPWQYGARAGVAIVATPYARSSCRLMILPC